MGNCCHSCLVDIVEQVLWGESASLSEGSGAESLEHGRLDAVVEGLGGLTLRVSSDVVQAIVFTERVLGLDTAFKGRHVLGEGH